ncbi:MAG: glycoside hydrolase family 5 protein [Spirochaetes bacterium]|nr:glycoside hydrolase family 5 protein [Spirochaetota bacterium]
MQLKKLFQFIFVLLMLLSFLCGPVYAQRKMDFWKTQKKGANGGLSRFRPEWFVAAKAAGLQFIRFNISSLPAEDTDFLIGNADHFTRLNQKDLKLLLQVLDEAEKNNLKIVVSLFSLPGCRTRQDNDGKSDYRLWREEKYQIQAFKFWKQLAGEIKNHPAVIGYNPLNEPHPELQYGHEEADRDFTRWLKISRNTPADLNRFNRKMIEAIRSVDKTTPILLDGYFYADPMGMPYFEPVEDPYIIYTFHNPAPWQFAAFRINKGRYSYPDRMPDYWNAPGRSWTIDDLEKRLEPVKDFCRKNNIPSYQVAASEFWCDRRVTGCKEYLADVIKLYNAQQWHWAFYSFRDDSSWGGLDYELGDARFGSAYWEAVENGTDPELLKKRFDNPIWDVIKRELE